MKTNTKNEKSVENNTCENVNNFTNYKELSLQNTDKNSNLEDKKKSLIVKSKGLLNKFNEINSIGFLRKIGKLNKKYILAITAFLVATTSVTKASLTLDWKNFGDLNFADPSAATIAGGWTSRDLSTVTGSQWFMQGITISTSGADLALQSGTNSNIKVNDGAVTEGMPPFGSLTFTVNIAAGSAAAHIIATTGFNPVFGWVTGTTSVSAGEQYSVNNGSFSNATDLIDQNNWELNSTNGNDPYLNSKTFAADGGIVLSNGNMTLQNTATFDIWIRGAGGKARWQDNVSNGYTVTYTQDTDHASNVRDFFFTMIPEPSNAIMILLGFSILGFNRNRKKLFSKS